MLLSKFSRGRQGFMFQKYRCLAVWLECEVHTWGTNWANTFSLDAGRTFSISGLNLPVVAEHLAALSNQGCKMLQAKELQQFPSHLCVNCTGSVHGWIETGLLTLKYLPDSGPAPSPVFLQSGSSWQGSLCICSSGFLFQCFYATLQKCSPCWYTPPHLTIMYQIFKYYHVKSILYANIYMSMMSVLYVSAVKYF